MSRRALIASLLRHLQELRAAGADRAFACANKIVNNIGRGAGLFADIIPKPMGYRGVRALCISGQTTMHRSSLKACAQLSITSPSSRARAYLKYPHAEVRAKRPSKGMHQQTRSIHPAL